MRRKKTVAPAPLVAEEPTATHTLAFNEPMDLWLASDDFAAQSAAERILAEHDITLIDSFGGSGVGPWATGYHEAGYDINADDRTAAKMAGLIQAEIGYLVTVTKRDEEEIAEARSEALHALRRKLTSGQEVDDSEFHTPWWVKQREPQIRVLENTLTDLITQYEERLLAVEEATYDQAFLLIRGHR